MGRCRVSSNAAPAQRRDVGRPHRRIGWFLAFQFDSTGAVENYYVSNVHKWVRANTFNSKAGIGRRVADPKGVSPYIFRSAQWAAVTVIHLIAPVRREPCSPVDTDDFEEKVTVGGSE